MSAELSRRAATPARIIDTRLVREARLLYQEVQLADLKASGSFALAAKLMQLALELNEVRQQLSQGDPLLSAMLADFQVIANQKAKNIQRGLFPDFGL